ncbi:MAG TPA: acyl-CoA thioesterase domain-containing protein, partial [Ilumatobacteraceae bacterium]
MTSTADAPLVSSFAAATRIHRQDDGTYTATLQPSWLSLVGIHGGYAAAIAANAAAATVDDESQVLRSVSTQFVRSPVPGDVVVVVDVRHRGRRTTFATATMFQDDRVVLLVTVVCGSTRGGLAYGELVVPRPAMPPAELPRFEPTHGVKVGHFVNAELYLDPDVHPFAG